MTLTNWRLLNAVSMGDPEKVRNALARADPNTAVWGKGTPTLIVAVWHEHDESVWLLLKNNAYPNAPDPPSGRTALHYAGGVLNPKIVTMLLDGGANPNIRSLTGSTALWLTLAGLDNFG